MVGLTQQKATVFAVTSCWETGWSYTSLQGSHVERVLYGSWKPPGPAEPSPITVGTVPALRLQEIN